MGGGPGIAFHDGALDVGEMTQIDRFAVDPIRLQATDDQTISTGLPAGGRHTTRTVQFGPNGGLYVSIGSSCDLCIEADARRPTIMRFDTNGANG